MIFLCGDNEVTIEDHHAIASYMSDVITAVKGQAISSNETIDSFTIGELIKRVSILMKHELKHSLVELNTHISIDEEFKLYGSMNSLVQVIDNLVSNAIQSYGGKPDNVIDFSIDMSDRFYYNFC